MTEQEASGLPGRVITESVDGSLTSIVQPCDVRLIAILKRGIRSKFYLAVMRKVVAGTLKVGDMVQLSREEIVALCEEAFNEFNENQKVDHAIAQAFEVCGMNPFSYSTEHFDKHLASLSEDGIYKALHEANKEEDLAQRAKK